MNKELVTKSELRELSDRMTQKYKVSVGDRRFSIEFEEQGTHVSVKTTLSSRDESYVYPVEASLDCAEEEVEPRKGILFLIDYIDCYFEDFLMEDESLYLPIIFKSMSYEGISFKIKGQILNKRAEAWADEILAKGEKYEGPEVVKF